MFFKETAKDMMHSNVHVARATFQYLFTWWRHALVVFSKAAGVLHTGLVWCAISMMCLCGQNLQSLKDAR